MASQSNMNLSGNDTHVSDSVLGGSDTNAILRDTSRTREEETNTQEIESQLSSPETPYRGDTGAVSSGNDDKPSSEVVKRSLSRKYILVEGKTAQYNRFHFKDRENALAFETTKNAITTKHSDKYIARDMLSYAEANGWQNVSIKGSNEFKQAVWLEASIRDVGVKGYRPNSLDKAKLVDARAQEARSVATREKVTRSINLNKPQETAVGVLKDTMQKRGDSPDAVNVAVEKVKQRFVESNTIVGKVIGMGAAPYLHKDGNNDSFYVDLKTATGDKKVWGVKLEELATKGFINKGDHIALERVGKEQVAVQAKVIDDDGKVRTKTIETSRQNFAVHNLLHLDEATRRKFLNQDKIRSHNPVVSGHEAARAKSAHRGDDHEATWSMRGDRG